MNCANHADTSAVAYCRTCGKALCANCTRPVRGVIYCEECIGARMAQVPPPTNMKEWTMQEGLGVNLAQPPGIAPPGPIPVPNTSGPNPTVAGILAGVFPFGVGAVYTGQYAKGLAHLAIFGLLIAGCNVHGSAVLPVVCGIGLAFFWVYQIVDAVRSAKAIQMGLPAPDPYGLAASFGGGKMDPTAPDASAAAKIPTGAIVLILLGALFLMHTAGLFEFGIDRFWPVLLMALGAWLFVRNYGLPGRDWTDPRSCRRSLMGPVLLFTIGSLFLIDNLHAASFDRTWPIILLAIGAVKLVQGNKNLAGEGCDLPVQPGVPPIPPVPPAPSAPASDAHNSEVKNG